MALQNALSSINYNTCWPWSSWVKRAVVHSGFPNVNSVKMLTFDYSIIHYKTFVPLRNMKENLWPDNLKNTKLSLFITDVYAYDIKKAGGKMSNACIILKKKFTEKLLNNGSFQVGMKKKKKLRWRKVFVQWNNSSIWMLSKSYKWLNNQRRTCTCMCSV